MTKSLNEGEYKKWLYYSVLELIGLYGRDKVLAAVHKMEKKYENLN